MKYLIEIHHGIGDIVQITGLMETINRTDQDAEIDVIVNSKMNAALLEEDTRIGQIFFLNLKTMTKIGIIQEVIKMRKKHYDYMFLSPISNQRDAQLLAAMVGAKNTFGEQLERISKWNKKYHYVPRQDVHIVQRNNNLLLSTKLVQSVCEPALKVKKIAAEKELEKLRAPIIGICIGTSKSVKTWPLEHYLYVAEQMEQKGYNVVFLGGPQEVRAAKDVEWEKHPHWFNYMGKTDLQGSAALLKHCCVVVGGDTGAMHIAAAVGCATVTLFTCSDPKYHAPYSDKSYVVTANIECQYCYAQGGYNECAEYRCRDLIDKDEVLCVVERVAQKKEAERYKFTKNE